MAGLPAQWLVQQLRADGAQRRVSTDLRERLPEVRACPLCGDTLTDGRSRPVGNLYSEQLALRVDCDEAALLAAVENVRCVTCGLWYKTHWFEPEVLQSLFGECVPDHPKGWDAVSGRFSEQGFASAVDGLAHALGHGSDADRARCRRALSSIIESLEGIDGQDADDDQRHGPRECAHGGLRARLLRAVETGDVTMLTSLRPKLEGHFDHPAPFKRFSGFSSPLLWDWMESHIGPVRRYGEVGCPLWGQLARPMDPAVQRWYFQRAEANYWGAGCCRGGQHCRARLEDQTGVEMQAWPPPGHVALDALGAFQYLDHLESPGEFATQAFTRARALLLVFDDGAEPSAIQHATGWDARPVAWLARRHGKRVVDDFAAIEGSGNHAWLLCDD